MKFSGRMRIGAHYSKEGTSDFIVWAPFARQVTLCIEAPRQLRAPMQGQGQGYWKVSLEGVSAGSRYRYELNATLKRPDPASFFQPQGVHRSSQIVDHADFEWSDASWKGIEPKDMVIYELHVGAFTPEGTFSGVIKRLDTLKEIGVNTVELMPVHQFPGSRNWGYDGVYPFAVQNSYGGPEGLKKLIDACHRKGLAVILDVVYNHLGPEGNYLADFGPYFTDKYKTPWGRAVNFDDAYSFGVRNFFVENMLYWFERYHADALRLDAVHGIFDMGAKHILSEMAEEALAYSKAYGRKTYLIAESDLNDSRIIRPQRSGGYGLDAQWCDEFHHCLHTVLTGEVSGYYRDFGTIGQMAASLKQGFVYTGGYSLHRKKNFGSSYKDTDPRQLVVFSQNHDQIGNRMFGERLSSLVDFESLKLAACCTMFSPFIPLIFMGEEYAEERPFLYFVSHTDANLIRAVRQGRKKEFKSFVWQGEPPDPQDEKTFLSSKLEWKARGSALRKTMAAFYKEAIALRKKIPSLSALSKKDCRVFHDEDKRIIIMERWASGSRAALIMNFSQTEQAYTFSFLGERWRKSLDSSVRLWRGPGSHLPAVIKGKQLLTLKPRSCVLYEEGTSR